MVYKLGHWFRVVIPVARHTLLFVRRINGFQCVIKEERRKKEREGEMIKRSLSFLCPK